MLFRILFLTLCIFQTICNTDGQTVLAISPVETCTAQSMTLRCPNDYVVVIKSAFYGVARTTNLCSYQPGDCISDTLSTVSCLTDSVVCGVYAFRQKLPQCNDQLSSYLHVEYDCVPLSMKDSSKVYDVCQNDSEITSTNGIIRSPGYPTQFQTTTNECIRAIHVPNDKTIRLWLTDLYIGSTASNCAKDHVYVVDNVQTFRHCAIKRFAYPNLCSSTILIQYWVTSKQVSYRGMRMYFEIVDRDPNDGCPVSNVTVTPLPDSTTTITTIAPDITTLPPIYVILGISSPTRNFQLCKGDSHLLQCPSNYGIAISTNIFGATSSDTCEEHDASKHCVVTTEPTLNCRQQCSYLYTGNQRLPSCQNKTAAYQYVEYQCIPTASDLVLNNTVCPSDGSKIPIKLQRRGRFRSYNYPTIRAMNCTYQFTTDPGYIMNFYALDVSLNDGDNDCTSNKIVLADSNQAQDNEFCEERSYKLLYSSCSNRVDLQYVVTKEKLFFSSGVELYIESLAAPIDRPCATPLTTTTQSTTTGTTVTVIPPTTSDPVMAALPEAKYDICFGSSLTQSCPTGYTFMILDAYYGVKKQSTNKCGFTQGDCVQEAASTITACTNDVALCYLSYSTKRRLAQCSDFYADYLHITAQCVPSRPVGAGAVLPVYDICNSTDDIQELNGVISSPGFPSYRVTNNECKRKIVGIMDRVLKIWINEMSLASGTVRSEYEETDQPDLVIHKTANSAYVNEFELLTPDLRDVCVKDYLIIDSPDITYVFCGKRKLALAPLCETFVTIKYKTTANPLLTYKGFKLYYEWIPKPVFIVCPSIVDPTLTTTPDNTPWPLWAQNLELSDTQSKHICLGSSEVLKCSRQDDYALSIIDSNYAVTGTGLCEVPSNSHCKQEASLSLSCGQSCTIQYIIPQSLSYCNDRDADYLNIDYQCIPTRLPNNENPTDICSATTTGTIAIDRGILVSPQYPTLGAARTCSKKIEATPNKLWKIFITDLNIESENDIGDCDAASLTIFDGNEKIILCGSLQPQLLLISCSNIVQFNFVSTHQAIGYRGFKVYFTTVDQPAVWGCNASFTNATTTTMRTTTTGPSTTTLVPPSLLIAAYGGTTNGTRQYCKFPFIYQGKQESGCLRSDPPVLPADPSDIHPWCSLTSNFDVDRQWGFCHLGVTDSTIYDICRSQSRTLTCPPGYVIDLITADYAAKPDGNIGSGACTYDSQDCFQNDAAFLQIICAGKTSCTATHYTRTLASCQNRPSAYYHIDYKCIPNDIPEITYYNLCNSTFIPTGNARRGFITSPGYPAAATDLDCIFNLNTVKPHQDIYLYIVDMDLNQPNFLGQTCTKDRFIVTADNGQQEICGKKPTDLLVNTCHESINLQLIRTAGASGRGVKLYFEFVERPPSEPCTPLITTSTRASTLPPASTSTAAPVLPSYFPHPSPRLFKSFCYLDVSGLFGINNVQCPRDYVIVVHRAFYGKGSRCDYTPGDCTTEADSVYRTCAGKQGCSVTFVNIVQLPECNKVTANYLFMEYQCLPTPTIAQTVQDTCSPASNELNGESGVLRSPSYPTYTPGSCGSAIYGSPTGSNLVVFMYLLDLSISAPDANSGQCTNDYLSISYQCNNQIYSETLCGTRSTELLFYTCAPTDKVNISYSINGGSSETGRGFALLYHILQASSVTFTTPKLTSLTTPTTTVKPSGSGALSTDIEQSITCAFQTKTMQCSSSEYALIIHKVYLVASQTNTCSFSAFDCYEDRTNMYNLCSGKASCSLFTPSTPIKACNNSKSNYLYTEHQCIPRSPKVNLDICTAAGRSERVEGGAIISSLNYTSISQTCQLQIQSNPLLGSQTHRAFKVFILSLDLPMQRSVREQGSQCGDTDPTIEIDDPEKGVTRLCGSSHSRYLMETCSTYIDVRFKNAAVPTSTKYKGFEIYFESIINEKCRVDPATTPPPQTQALAIETRTACALANDRNRVSFSCSDNHALVFLQSYEFATRQPDRCDLSQPACYYPSNEPATQCSSQQSCVFTYTPPLNSPGNVCQNRRADAIQFYYQCLPMRPVGVYQKKQFCSDTTLSGDYGFIETPNFPTSYESGQRQCSIRIQLPSDNQFRQYSVYLYVIELSLRDSSLDNPTGGITCQDSIIYSDGTTTKPLCGKIDQPMLEYATEQKELTLTLNISQGLPPSEWNNWRGARLFYLIAKQSLPVPPTGPSVITSTSTSTPRTTVTTTTRKDVEITTDPTQKKPKHTGAIVGAIIGVLIALAIIIVGTITYRRRQAARASNGTGVVYDHGQGSVGVTTSSEPSQSRTPIRKTLFTGSRSFVSPFATRESTVTTGATVDSADA